MTKRFWPAVALSLLPMLLVACPQPSPPDPVTPDGDLAQVVTNYTADPAFKQIRGVIAPDTFDAPEQQALDLVNQARAKGAVCSYKGVQTVFPASAPLKLEGHLQRAAEWHAADMQARNYMDHKAPAPAPHGIYPINRILNAGYLPPSSVVSAENIAANSISADPAAVVAKWLASDDFHCNAMMDPTKIDAGLALVGTHWALDLGQPK
ncbi:CAP domain-containing protein [Deinococcus sp. KNUC1210]|uniref:CAP domain-containing protein n=1 Tax=Deinococcus sp. KNUC1210 TaxID=2917691 RepID=UPI001EEF9387|nr:CAP domain-containing protein [Deinococcus sp. KNUC1210]ULH15884.1 CAP domain-containing protein [Deinococcus sp. KNUC1210]